MVPAYLRRQYQSTRLSLFADARHAFFLTRTAPQRNDDFASAPSCHAIRDFDAPMGGGRCFLFTLALVGMD